MMLQVTCMKYGMMTLLPALALVCGADALPHFHIANCHGASSVGVVVLSRLAFEDREEVLPELAARVPESIKLNVTLSHVPSCNFADEGEELFHVLKGSGTSAELGPATAFGGCGCSSGTQIMSALAGVRLTPLISGSATASSLSDGLYPSLMRTIPNDAVQAECHARLLAFNWWQLSFWITFRGEVYGTNLVQEIAEAAGWFASSVHVIYAETAPLESPEDWYTLNVTGIALYLQLAFPPTSLWPRVVGLSTHSRLRATVIIRELLRGGFINPRVVTLGTDALCYPDALSEFAPDIDAWREKDEDYFGDPFWLNPMVHLEKQFFCTRPDSRSPLIHSTAFSQWLSTLSSTDMEAAGAPSGTSVPTLEELEGNFYFPLIFDAMLTIWLTLAELLHQQTAPEAIGGETLLQALSLQHFLGLSGNVSFLERERVGGYLVSQALSMNESIELIPMYYYLPGPSSIRLVRAKEGEFGLTGLMPLEFADGSQQLPPLKLCPDGEEPVAEVYENLSRAEVCRPCDVGKFRTVDATWAFLPESCLPCPVRQYQPTPGQNNCVYCDVGTFQNETDSTACTTCPLGRAQDDRAQTECFACPPGSYTGIVGMSVCTACEVGKHQAEHGQSACVICEDSDKGMSTSGTGARSPTECRCAAGFYELENLTCMAAPQGRDCGFASSIYECTCRLGTRAFLNSDGCVPCEEHLVCDGGHSLSRSLGLHAGFDDTVRVEEGYMTRSDDPYSVYKCVATRTCPGERSPFPEVWSEQPLQRMCVEGVDVDTRCGRCEEGRHGHAGHACLLCGGDERFLFYLKLSLTFLANVGMVAYFYKRFNRPNPAGMITLASIINVLQSLQTFGKMPLEWPGPLKSLFQVIEVVASVEGLMAFLEFRTECLTGNNYVAALIKEVLSPLLIFIDFALIYVVVRLVGRNLRKAYVHNVVGMLFTRLFINIIRLSLTLFYRESMPNGKVMVTAVPTLEFLSEEWTQLLPINAAATLGYGGTTFCYVAYLVHSAPYRVATEKDFLDKARFCFGSFRPDRHWWILVHLSYGFVLNLSQVVTPASNVHSKVYMALFFLIIFLVLEFRCKPFKFAENNAVDILFNTLLIALLIVSTSFIETDTISVSEKRAWNDVYGLFVLGFFAVGLGWAIYRFVHWMWSAAQHKGIMEGERAQYGWQFRDCAVSLLLITDKDFMRRLCTLGDNDLKQLKHATDTIIAVFFGAHTSHTSTKQRIIPNHEYKVWNYEEMQLEAWEKVESGALRSQVAHSFRARSWLLQMAILAGEKKSLTSRSSSSGSPTPSEDLTQVPSPTPSENAGTAQWTATAPSLDPAQAVPGKQPIDSAPSERRGISTWNLAPVNLVKTTGVVTEGLSDVVTQNLRMPMLKHVERLVAVLDLHPNQAASREQFHQKVHVSFPDLPIPDDDIDRIFDIMDLDGSGEVHRSQFILVMHALVPSWMMEVQSLTHVVSGHTQESQRSPGARSDNGPSSAKNIDGAERIDTMLHHMTTRESGSTLKGDDSAHVAYTQADDGRADNLQELHGFSTVVQL